MLTHANVPSTCSFLAVRRPCYISLQWDEFAKIAALVAAFKGCATLLHYERQLNGWLHL